MIHRFWAKPDNDSSAVPRLQRVEETFVTRAAIVELVAGARTIRTTAEHPFWNVGRGWTKAGELKQGNALLSYDGRAVPLLEVRHTGETEAVYNFRVTEGHTYFVGCAEWGFGVWAHNSYTALRNEGLTKNQSKRANMLYSTRDAAAAEAYLLRQGFTGSRLVSLMDAAATSRSGAQRGPNGTSGHDEMIRQIAREVTENGDSVLNGGKSFDGIYRHEAVFDTNGGFLSSRRPDILVRRPDGSIYWINVGQTGAAGLPVPRERMAIQDLNEQRGLEMRFVSYGRRQ